MSPAPVADRPVGNAWPGRIRWLAGAGALAAQGIAVAGLIGWPLGSRRLVAWHSEGSAIDPVVALGLALAGVLLWPVPGVRPPGLPWIRNGLAGAVVLAGVAGLAELLGGDVGLAGWLAPRWREAFGANDGRTFNASVALLLLGLGLGLIAGESPRRRSIAHGLLLGLALCATSGLAGFAMRTSGADQLGSAAPMAVPSAVACLVLAVSALVSRADRGLVPLIFSEGQGGSLARRLLPFTLLLPTLLGWILLNNGSMRGYRPEFPTVLLAISSAIVFFGLVWWYASFVDQAEARDRRSDAALRSSEAFYHSLVESLPQSILRKGVDGRFTFGNGKVLDAMGLRADELVGKTDFDFYPTPLAEKYRRDDEHVLATGEGLDTIEAHVEPGGDLRYVQVIKTPLRDHDGRTVGVQCFFWDVTERKIAEEKLQTQNALLSEMARSEKAAHEARKRAQAQLVQSAKLAGLGEMVAGVAHEINNPLSFVGNNVAVLERDLGDVRRLLDLYVEGEPILDRHDEDLLRRIRAFRDEAETAYTLANLDGLLARTREGVRRIQQIVKDLRVFARLDESDIADYDLNDSVRSTVTIIMGNAKRKHVAVDLDLGPLPKTTGYATKINQVVMNLVGNAIDACEEGGKVVVRTRVDPRGDGVVLEVADDGCGIDPAILGRIFDPFFTTKPVGVGTGLGLSISYGIVQDHGGSIDVESTPGQGTRFLVRLPLDCRFPEHRPLARAALAAGPDRPLATP